MSYVYHFITWATLGHSNKFSTQMQAGDSATNLFSSSLKKFAARPSWFHLLVKHHCGPSTPDKSHAGGFFLYSLRETQAGVEPANGGFANRSVRPLRHCVILLLRAEPPGSALTIDTILTYLEKFFILWYSVLRVSMSL